MKYLLYSIIFLLCSCGTIQPKIPDFSEKTIINEPSMGSLRIPIEYNLSTIFKEVDDALDYQFKGQKNQCEDVSFNYVFKRNPIEFSGTKNSIISTVNGGYSIKANYCTKCSEVFGFDPFCLTPRLYVSCGVGEPLRKIQLQFETQLELSPDYRLSGKSKLKDLKTLDPCEFTFIKYDASKLIENEISKALKDVEKEMDAELKKIDLKPTIQKAWNEFQLPIEIPEIGFLHFQPQSIGIDEFQFDKNKVFTVLELGVKPIILSSPKKEATAIPALKSNKFPEGIKIPILLSLNYDSLNAVIDRNFQVINLPLGKKKIEILNIDLIGPKAEKTIIRVDFDGSKKGVLFLTANANFKDQGKTIAFENVEFELETKNVLLKSAKWLFQDKIAERIEEKLIFNIQDQLADAKNKIEVQLNQNNLLPNGQKLKMKGTVKELQPIQIIPTKSKLDVFVFLTGNLTIVVD
ncbi:MAG: DUF4403 family protein [Bacteroidetes bacterium]|nr:DUF4403 family protein [Bacteroidota bacterium]